GPLEGTANSLSRKIKSMRNRMCAWKQRDNRIHCNSILTCESGFARYSVLLNMPVSPVHLRESPLEKADRRRRLVLTARGGVRRVAPEERLPVRRPIVKRRFPGEPPHTPTRTASVPDVFPGDQTEHTALV
ncbi:MAG: hypothetical protein VXW79_00455, partial [Bacteroidota bacterium]|nr:hypothetical protein [Bacteroidota bacterium]